MKEFYFKKLDLYIFWRFIVSFFVAILLIIGIVIIFDISEKIDNFVEYDAPLKAIIFDYYVNFVPMAFPWGWLVLLNAGVVALSLVVLLAPSAIVTKISPAQVMHFE